MINKKAFILSALSTVIVSLNLKCPWADEGVVFASLPDDRVSLTPDGFLCRISDFSVYGNNTLVRIYKSDGNYQYVELPTVRASLMCRSGSSMARKILAVSINANENDRYIIGSTEGAHLRKSVKNLPLFENWISTDLRMASCPDYSCVCSTQVQEGLGSLALIRVYDQSGRMSFDLVSYNQTFCPIPSFLNNDTLIIAQRPNRLAVRRITMASNHMGVEAPSLSDPVYLDLGLTASITSVASIFIAAERQFLVAIGLDNGTIGMFKYNLETNTITNLQFLPTYNQDETSTIKNPTVTITNDGQILIAGYTHNQGSDQPISLPEHGNKHPIFIRKLEQETAESKVESDSSQEGGASPEMLSSPDAANFSSPNPLPES